MMEFPFVIKKIHRKCYTNGKHTIQRFMTKSGHLNLQLSQVPYYKYFRFTKDFANTLVSLRWRWVTFMVVAANFFFYVAFAGLWMLDAWLSDDFNPAKTHNFCVEHARCFTGYLLLSVETITTTGYGYLYPTENCQFAWFTLMLSTIVMILIDGTFISIVFLKICKPLRKDGLTLFSKKCVICLRNGKLCLVFRVNDHLNKHAIESKVTIYFVGRSNVKQEDFHASLQEMEVTSGGMFLWPTDVVHQIDEDSPFWKLSASDIMSGKFEILVTLSGTSFVTDQFSTSQTSYLNEEILWGFRFKSCMEYDEKVQRYVVNEQDIFKLMPCDTPLCSASTLKKIQTELNQLTDDPGERN
ncbi:hypothetical protein Zmor_025220 [Zophobas morio]|uniref:Uncharacterized protein n=1 Tax=Zophobas morio TaxID=2755281 RepID=A0AA38HR45_9CUCU|nr:hypothetical protein Zmor_025220 [Zophobas morio]